MNKAKTWIGFLMLSPNILMGLLWMVFGIARSWVDEIYWASVHLPKTADEAIATGVVVGIPALCGIWLLKK
ncbi:MAG: hypothetical protein HWD92_04420 [Flavobacteriia bacterium]|nr:hypothetical protein [Flavobacteriia bacterium]